jgi:hypothetical protein
MRGGGRLLFVAFVFVPGAASPQGDPLGPEFRVSTYTTNGQGTPALGSNFSGNFVVVWTSLIQDGSGGGIFGQRYDSSGAPLGPEFRINTYTTHAQGLAAVASDSSGNFVVVWASYQDGSLRGVFGQRYASTGEPLGLEFRVNTHTTNRQKDPAVASDSSGNFVVVWSGAGTGDTYGIFGQRYANTGEPLGPEFRVNTRAAPVCDDPAVASDPSGHFVVVWDGGEGVQFARNVSGQRYASTGEPIGPEFRVNTYTMNWQTDASVTSDPSGNFVVVWASRYQDGSVRGVFGQRYASTGAPLGPEFRVNTQTTDAQGDPAVASDSSGNFVVVWNSLAQDGSGYSVFAQRYADTGEPLGPEFRVNTCTTHYQRGPAVASAASGNFVVVWQSFNQDGDDLGVFGQRYSAIVPVELTHFEVE